MVISEENPSNQNPPTDVSELGSEMVKREDQP
jgi:hypothetical protein